MSAIDNIKVLLGGQAPIPPGQRPVVTLEPLSIPLGTQPGSFVEVNKSLTTEFSTITSSKGAPFWGDFPAAWDVVVISGPGLVRTAMPGKATVKGKLERKLDMRTAPGTHGARLNDLGRNPSDITVRLLMWTEAHLRGLEEIALFVKPNRGGQITLNQCVQLEHPSLAVFKLSFFVIVSITVPEMVQQDVFASEMHCIEFVPNRDGQVVKKEKTPSLADAVQTAIPITPNATPPSTGKTATQP